MLWLKRCFGQQIDEPIWGDKNVSCSAFSLNGNENGGWERSNSAVLDQAAFQRRFSTQLPENGSPHAPATYCAASPLAPQASSSSNRRLAAACLVVPWQEKGARRARRSLVVEGGGSPSLRLSVRVVWVASDVGAGVMPPAGRRGCHDTDPGSRVESYQQLLTEMAERDAGFRDALRESCGASHRGAYCAIKHKPPVGPGSDLVAAVEVSTCMLVMENSRNAAGLLLVVHRPAGPGLLPPPRALPDSFGRSHSTIAAGRSHSLTNGARSQSVTSEGRGFGLGSPGLGSRVAPLEYPMRVPLPQRSDGQVPLRLPSMTRPLPSGGSVGGPLPSATTQMRLAAAARAVAAEVLPASIMVFTYSRGDNLEDVAYLNSRAREYLCLGACAQMVRQSQTQLTVAGLHGLPARVLLAAILQYEASYVVRQLHNAAATEQGFNATVKVPSFIDAAGLALSFTGGTEGGVIEAGATEASATEAGATEGGHTEEIEGLLPDGARLPSLRTISDISEIEEREDEIKQRERSSRGRLGSVREGSVIRPRTSIGLDRSFRSGVAQSRRGSFVVGTHLTTRTPSLRAVGTARSRSSRRPSVDFPAEYLGPELRLLSRAVLSVHGDILRPSCTGPVGGGQASAHRAAAPRVPQGSSGQCSVTAPVHSPRLSRRRLQVPQVSQQQPWGRPLDASEQELLKRLMSHPATAASTSTSLPPRPPSKTNWPGQQRLPQPSNGSGTSNEDARTLVMAGSGAAFASFSIVPLATASPASPPAGAVAAADPSEAGGTQPLAFVRVRCRSMGKPAVRRVSTMASGHMQQVVNAMAPGAQAGAAAASAARPARMSGIPATGGKVKGRLQRVNTAELVEPGVASSPGTSSPGGARRAATAGAAAAGAAAAADVASSAKSRDSPDAATRAVQDARSGGGGAVQDTRSCGGGAVQDARSTAALSLGVSPDPISGVASSNITATANAAAAPGSDAGPLRLRPATAPCAAPIPDASTAAAADLPLAAQPPSAASTAAASLTGAGGRQAAAPAVRQLAAPAMKKLAAPAVPAAHTLTPAAAECISRAGSNSGWLAPIPEPPSDPRPDALMRAYRTTDSSLHAAGRSRLSLSGTGMMPPTRGSAQGAPPGSRWRGCASPSSSRPGSRTADGYSLGGGRLSPLRLPYSGGPQVLQPSYSSPPWQGSFQKKPPDEKQLAREASSQPMPVPGVPGRRPPVAWGPAREHQQLQQGAAPAQVTHGSYRRLSSSGSSFVAVSSGLAGVGSSSLATSPSHHHPLLGGSSSPTPLHRMLLMQQRLPSRTRMSLESANIASASQRDSTGGAAAGAAAAASADAGQVPPTAGTGAVAQGTSADVNTQCRIHAGGAYANPARGTDSPVGTCGQSTCYCGGGGGGGGGGGDCNADVLLLGVVSGNVLSGGGLLGSGLSSTGAGGGGGGTVDMLQATFREVGISRWEGAAPRATATTTDLSYAAASRRPMSGLVGIPSGSGCWSSNAAPIVNGPANAASNSAVFPTASRSSFAAASNIPFRGGGARRGNSVRARVHALLDQAEQAELLRGGSGGITSASGYCHSLHMSHSSRPGSSAASLGFGFRPLSVNNASGTLPNGAGGAPISSGSAAGTAASLRMTSGHSSVPLVPYEVLHADSGGGGGGHVQGVSMCTEPYTYGDRQSLVMRSVLRQDSSLLQLLTSCDEPPRDSREAPGGGGAGPASGVFVHLGDSGGVGGLATPGGSVSGGAAAAGQQNSHVSPVSLRFMTPEGFAAAGGAVQMHAGGVMTAPQASPGSYMGPHPTNTHIAVTHAAGGAATATTGEERGDTATSYFVDETHDQSGPRGVGFNFFATRESCDMQNLHMSIDGGGGGGNGGGHDPPRGSWNGGGGYGAPAAPQVSWCQLRARTCMTVDGRRVLMLIMSDVTKQIQNQERVAALVEQEHRILEALFPRHVIAYLTTPTGGHGEDEEGAAVQDDEGGGGGGGGGGGSSLSRGRRAGGIGGGGEPRRRNQLLVGASSPSNSATRAHSQMRRMAQQQHLNTLKVSQLATEHRMVTILFSDIVGFTAFSRQVQPLTVMRFLNELYQKLDALLDIYKVYKVETIGDCYVVAGGLVRYDADGLCTVLPEGEADELHAVRVMQFAKAMLRASREVMMPTSGEAVQVRLGLHSGPAMSGVVGSKMPRFTVFGETVEAAHTMESSGRPGRIHVSGVTKELLKREAWEQTEGVQIEGRGKLDTYLWLEEEEDDSHKQRVMAVYL